MQPEKRKTITSYFAPDNKKPRNEEQQESAVVDPLSSSEQQVSAVVDPFSSSEQQESAVVDPLSSLEQQESVVVDPLSSPEKPCSDSPDQTPSMSPSIEETIDITPVTKNSGNKSVPIDISTNCYDVPSQPKLSSYPSNFQNRSFRLNWFVNRSWLEYSLKNDRIYCFNCRHFRAYKANVGDAFTTCGYNNWKRALESGGGLYKHEQSQAHIISTKNFESFKLRQQLQLSVINSLDSSRNLMVRRNRDRLIKISSTLLLLAKQMIALRGHQENEKSENRGNFIEILRWASLTDPIVKSIFEDSSSNATYLSHDVQNELLNIMANQIRQRISNMLNNQMYALMADESKDVGGNQQLSVVIRFTPDYGNNQISVKDVVSDFFLGFIHLIEFDAATLTSKIVEFLSLLNIPLLSCIALCFDGASVMSGCNAGVHVLLRKNHMPKGIYIHCSCHRLNLVLNDTCKAVPYMNDYFSILSTVYTFFTESGVTNMFFKKAQEDLQLTQASVLKLWAITRWDSRWQSIDSIINNYPALIKALQDLSEEDSGTRSINATGLLIHMKKSIFIISSFILHKLLGLTKILSDQLKSPSLDYARSEFLISSVIQQISELRNDQPFTDIYSQATEFCKLNDIELVEQYRPRRIAAIPARFKECIISSTLGQREVLSTSADFCNKLFYPIIDCILLELKDRFSDKTLSLLKSLSTVYPESKNFLNVDDIKMFSDHIDGDAKAIKNEFMVIKPMLKNKPMSNVIEFLNELLPMKGAFPNTIQMIKAATTMPVSQVTCERSFSKMKLIKSYLRNSMLDARLSDLTVLSIERSFEIDFEQVVDTFANNHKNSRIILH